MSPRIPRMSPANHGRLAFAVYQSEHLSALLPADELAPLLDEYSRAMKLADAARQTRFDAADAMEEVREALATGAEVDVPAVIARMTSDRAEKAAHDAAVAAFAALPNAAHQRIVRFIDASEPDLYEGLANQLSDVLDRAADALTALGDVRSAEEAIPDKVAEYAAFRECVRTYDAVREAQTKLLAAEDPSNASGPQLARLMFGGLAAVAPDHVREINGAVVDLRGQRVSSAFDPLATGSSDHLREVVRLRQTLRPQVVHPDEAHAAPTAIAIPAVVSGGRSSSLTPGQVDEEIRRGQARASREAS